MIVRQLRLHNWLSYRGEYVLELQPKAYGIACQYAHDPDRSNFGGKSALLEAIDFALFGRHRHRTEDEFISRGEKEAEITLVLDDGSALTRARKRGKSTRLTFHRPGESAPVQQDQAQLAIQSLLGMDADDFVNTAYFQQRQMARLVLARPEERMAVVGAWLRLEKLVRCEELVRRRANEIERHKVDVEARIRVTDDIEASTGDVASLRARAEKLAIDVEEVGREMEVARERIVEAEGQQKQRDLAREYEQVVAEGKRLRPELDAMGDEEALRAALEGATTAEKAATQAWGQAQREATQKRQLASGQFDGTCPVAGITCPAKAEINARTAENEKLHRAATRGAAIAEHHQDTAAKALQAAQAGFQAQDRTRRRLEDLRGRAGDLRAAFRGSTAGPVDPAPLRVSLSALQDRHRGLMQDIGAVRRDIEAVERAAKQREQARAEVAVLDGQLVAHRAAQAVFGRQGAQRRVAEAALGAIEAGANDLLGACGVELRVAMTWAREGTGLAKHCESCGAPFPSSAKVKECTVCHAPRGPLLVQRLEVELSDRSGAAEDLGGIAIQLAASAWLRAERGSAWRALLLDEPGAQFDRANRRAFTSHLAKLVDGAGFAQAFVVAHDPAMLEALPGKILVESRGGWSTARVVA